MITKLSTTVLGLLVAGGAVACAHDPEPRFLGTPPGQSTAAGPSDPSLPLAMTRDVPPPGPGMPISRPGTGPVITGGGAFADDEPAPATIAPQGTIAPETIAPGGPAYTGIPDTPVAGNAVIVPGVAAPVSVPVVVEPGTDTDTGTAPPDTGATPPAVGPGTGTTTAPTAPGTGAAPPNVGPGTGASIPQGPR